MTKVTTTRICLIFGSLSLGIIPIGCKQALPIMAPIHAANLANEAHRHGQQVESYQKYELDEVKKRSKHLRAGMSKYHVLVTLGSPAEKTHETWIYRSMRPGLLLPTNRLYVQFQSGRYVRHGTRAVILGEDF